MRKKIRERKRWHFSTQVYVSCVEIEESFNGIITRDDVQSSTQILIHNANLSTETSTMPDTN